MDITIREITTRKDKKTFIHLPAQIHKGRKNWVPPIYMDEWNYFDPKKNKGFSYSDTVLLLAFRGDQAVGRVMGIINHRFNELKNDKTARFGYLEAIEDETVVRSLLGFVEDWSRQKGMKRIIGPYGFTDQDPEGFIIEGFEHRATIATYFNMEWMPPLLEKLGYAKDIDYYVYELDVPREMPEFYKKIYERVQKKGNYEVLEFRKRKDLKPWIVPIFTLMNECYIGSDIYGYAPLDEKEMHELAKRYLPIVDPRFIKAVKAGDELVSFIIGMPDMSEGIQKAKGRLFPFGFLKILRAAKKTKQLDLLLGAIKENYRGRGLDVLMGVKMLMSAQEAGLEFIDTHHEMEANVKVRAEMVKMGGKLYKRYRVYQKAL